MRKSLSDTEGCKARRSLWCERSPNGIVASPRYTCESRISKKYVAVSRLDRAASFPKNASRVESSMPISSIACTKV